MSSGIPTGDRVQQLREHLADGKHPDSFVPESEPETEKHQDITVAECLRMRDWHEDPDTSLADIGDVVGVSYDTVWSHVNGKCEHANITKRQCNAIRCAAQDGKNAGEIANLFDCVTSRRTVYDHITNSQYCPHDGGVEPVMETETIDAADCRRIRSWYESTDVRQRDIADAVGCPRTTVRYHLNGKCSHDHD
jgi:predicted DNA-binding protein YlxM (UPF0122 family)